MLRTVSVALLVFTAIAFAGCRSAPVETQRPDLVTRQMPGLTLGEQPVACPDDLPLAVVFRGDGPDGSTALVLHDRLLVGDEHEAAGFAGDVDGAEVELTLEQASALGMTRPAAPARVYTRPGLPTCSARATTPIAIVAADGLGRTNLAWRLESDCEVDEDWQLSFALHSDAPLSCEMKPVETMGAHKRETVLAMKPPRELVDALDPASCAEPCRMMWRMSGGRDLAGRGFYELRITHALPPEGDEPDCARRTRDFGAVLYTQSSASALEPVSDELRGLSALFFDDRGLRAAVANHDGELRTIVVDDTMRPRVATSYRWMIPLDEESEGDSLWPGCL